MSSLEALFAEKHTIDFHDYSWPNDNLSKIILCNDENGPEVAGPFSLVVHSIDPLKLTVAPLSTDATFVELKDGSRSALVRDFIPDQNQEDKDLMRLIWQIPSIVEAYRQTMQLELACKGQPIFINQKDVDDSCEDARLALWKQLEFIRCYHCNSKLKSFSFSYNGVDFGSAQISGQKFVMCKKCKNFIPKAQIILGIREALYATIDKLDQELELFDSSRLTVTCDRHFPIVETRGLGDSINVLYE